MGKELYKYAQLLDSSLTDYFCNGGQLLSEEFEILCISTKCIVMSGRRITYKALILELIGMLEMSEDLKVKEVIRSTLEIIVYFTADNL